VSMLNFVSVDRGINSETFAPTLLIVVSVPLEPLIDGGAYDKEVLAQKIGLEFLDELERMNNLRPIDVESIKEKRKDRKE